MPTSERKSADPTAPSPPAGSREAAEPLQGVPASPVRELGGRAGPEPTRFGDWEKDGRCIDF